MTSRKVQFGLTLPNRGVVTGATTITLRLTSYSQESQFERVTDEVLAAFR